MISMQQNRVLNFNVACVLQLQGTRGEDGIPHKSPTNLSAERAPNEMKEHPWMPMADESRKK